MKKKRNVSVKVQKGKMSLKTLRVFLSLMLFSIDTNQIFLIFTPKESFVLCCSAADLYRRCGNS